MAGFYGRTGLEVAGDLIEGLQEAGSKVLPAAVAAAEAAAEIIRAKAYTYANVSPGELGHGLNGEHMRDEIRVKTYEYPTGVSSRIQIDMSLIPYAAHQEFGPRGNAFMRRAMDESRQEAHETMRTVFSAYMGADGKFKTKVRFRAFA